VGWLYIVVRNYPFWAIPIGLTLILEVLVGRTSKASGGRKFLMIFAGLFFSVSSILFLYFEGHRKAVPFVHELFSGVSK
jgi:hypothetical protein